MINISFAKQAIINKYIPAIKQIILDMTIPVISAFFP
jgi:hypothetical protein